MNGQQKNYSVHQKMVDDFLSQVNPYEDNKSSCVIDMRAYSAYLKENNLTGKDVSPEISKKFIIK